MGAVAGALSWDGVGQKAFERGVSKGVLYLYNSTTHKWEGVAWNGLTNETDSPEGGDAEDFYADNSLYASIRGVEKLNGSIEAFTYPEEFNACIGKDELSTGITIGQQSKIPFCFCYRTELGNDQNPEAGYKINLVYNATANAAEMSHDTDEESPNLEPISFDFSCTPVPVTGKKPTSKLEVNSITTPAAALAKIEAALYGTAASQGTEATVPYMPLPDDILDLIA